MKSTSFGHACWLIKTSGGRVLTDPVLSDPFEGGTVTACPSRRFLSDEPPEFDVLFISHRHLDHFHAPTLRRLPKDKPTLIPNDPWTIAAMEELGFRQLRLMNAFEAHRFEGESGVLEVHPIPSVSDDFVEYGGLFIDKPHGGPNRSLLNQVDVPLPNAVIDRINALTDGVDVHLAMYASQSFGWFLGLPENSSEVYTQNLHAATRLNARFVIPAAAGFRFVDDYDFLNQKLFPISIDRFLRDLRRLSPHIQAQAVHPGDRVDIENSIVVAKQASAEVEMISNDIHRLRFDPTAPSPPVIDRNRSNYPLSHLHAFADAALGKGMLAYLQAAIQIGEEKAAVYLKHSAVYRVDVVFPDGVGGWTYRFDNGELSMERNSSVPPDAMWRITSSALIDLCEGKRGCWSIRPESRKYGQLLVAHRRPNGVGAVQIQLPCLLTHFILNMRIRMVGERQAMLQYYGLLES